MLSFVEAFWVMGIIFWMMAPLLLLLRNARDLHPHVERPKPPKIAQTTMRVEEPEPELVGVLD